MSAAVSIVVPTRNRGELLLEAVRSALALDALEVVIADGGSDDRSVERAEALGDVRVVRGAWQNAAATRNAGAAAARGDYLGFLDSDDLAAAGKSTQLARRLDEEADVVLAHGAMTVIDGEGRADAVGTAAVDAAFAEARRLGTGYDALALHCAMFTSATLIRRSAFDAVGGYDERLDVYEDWDLYLRLSLRGRLVYDDAAAASYRIWPGNVRWDRTAAGVARVAQKHLAEPPPLPADAARRARYAFHRRLAESNHILVRGAAARRAAVAALRVQPSVAVRDRGVVGPLLRSLLPDALLRRRRPPLPS